VSAKKSLPKAEHRWRIIRLKSTPAAQLGTVTAPDEKSAIEKAAAQFEVPPSLRDRLVAQRVK
jgi:hypothetical protein